MPLTFKELKEFTVQQLATLKKEYEPMRGKTISIDNAKKLSNKLDVLTKDMLKKLANANIPFVSTSASSKLVTKHRMNPADIKETINLEEADELQQEACWTGYKQVGFKKSGRTGKRVPNCVPESVVKEESVEPIVETPMMSMNKQSPEYKQGQQAAKQGKKYIDNPHSDAQKKLNWSGGHNAYRLQNMGEERTYTVVHVKHGKEVVKANGTYDAAKKYAQMKGLKDTSGVDAHLMEETNISEGMFKRLLQTIHDKLEREGGAAGYDDLAKEVKKELNLDISKDTLKNMPGVKQHRDGDYILEADLSKSQVNMVHKKADDMPKKDFIKRYGKDGDSVRYATATNMVKKQLGIEEEEFVPEQKQKGDNMNEATYKDKFKAAMKDFGINSLDDLDSDADKKKFFKHVDAMHTAKNEELTPAQKKLPVGLQKAIKDKEDKKPKEDVVEDKGFSSQQIKMAYGILNDPRYKQGNYSGAVMAIDKIAKGLSDHPDVANALKRANESKEEIKEYGSMNAQYEMMKKEMMQKMEMMKAEADPEKMEMMKKEMMKEMEDMPEMMKKEMMKKMEMAMKEGFASDAQRKAAFASGYKEKGKKKKEEVSEMMKPQEMAVNAMAMNAMKMNAMNMPIRAMYKKELHQIKTGDDDMTPDALKLNAMVKDPHKSKEDKPMKDMNATYMKSDVRADVKNNGGADMAKVKDAPKMQTAMKKINAMYGESNIISASTINKREHNEDMKYLKTKPGSIEEAYLLARGIGEKSLTEAKYVIGMQDASYFKGNEMMSAMKAGNVDKLDMHAGDGTITFTANNPNEAQRNAEKAIKDYINKETRNDRNALFAFNDLELEEVDGDGPTRQQEQSIKRVLDKYSNKAMFNTPSGKASGPLQKFADDESLEDMAVSGVM